jgi:tungstate transport system ATP-binding protein
MIIEYKHLKHSFGKREILNDVSINLRPNKVILLTGENGCGKSTLLRVMAGLLKPDAGEIACAGVSSKFSQCQSALLEQVMYLHQTPYLFDGSVKQNLQYAHKKGRGDRFQLIDQALEWVGLSHLANENAKTLSGGERQRIALARALLRRPRILLLDEPTAHLDAISNAQISNLLGELKSHTVSMLIASHEPTYLSDLVNQEYRLDNGKLIEQDFGQNIKALDSRLSVVKNPSASARNSE